MADNKDELEKYAKSAEVIADAVDKSVVATEKIVTFVDKIFGNIVTIL